MTCIPGAFLMKNDIRLKLNLSFLYIRQLTRHLRTSGPTGLTVLEIFASVLANPFFHPDGLIISTAVKYARLFIFHFILGNKISDAYRVSLCLHKCNCLFLKTMSFYL